MRKESRGAPAEATGAVLIAAKAATAGAADPRRGGYATAGTRGRSDVA
jgi:hypothetical protein